MEKLDLKLFLDELRNRLIRGNNVIKTPALIEFVSTLGKNKSGSNNSIGRLQYFLNAYIQEMALIEENPGVLSFVNDDHEVLTRGNPGTNAPDLKLTTADGTFTVEVKKYWSDESYMINLPTTNFHNADYALVYLIANKGWYFSKKSENYENLYTAAELAETDPWLTEIKLPVRLFSVSFDIDKNAADNEIPEEVSYRFYNK